jgi:hypothetical protein
MQGTCKLCGHSGSLEESHFIPKFVGRWIKKTSATGYLRTAEEINRRAQDLAKEYWLCGKCEDLFAEWEREFSQKVFYPFVDQGASLAEYGEWMAKFCASLSWRTLSYIRHKNPQERPDEAELLDNAQRQLSAFLLGESTNLFEYEQHLFPLDLIESASAGNLPANIHRYFLRTVHMDVISARFNTIVYTKLPSFILLGFVKVKEAWKMRSSKIALKRGSIYPRSYYWPPGFMDYVTAKAQTISETYSDMSPKQLEKIDEYIRNNPEKVAQSETFKAFLNDYEMFGDTVFR